MNKVKRHSLLFLVLIGLLLIFSACSNEADADSNASSNSNVDTNSTDEKSDDNVEESVEQVTIKVAIPLNEEYFEGRFGEVDEKLDHIDLEYVPYGQTAESLEELFAAQINPDIIIGNYPPIRELGIEYPLDDLIEQFGFDIDTLDPSLLSFMQSLGDDGKIVGFPDGGSFFGLYYNKDVFDRLGKEYPDPDVPLTWTEFVNLAREMTVEVDGVQYIGYQGGLGTASAELAIRHTDPDTGEVFVGTDPDLRKYFELLESFYSIPGLDDPDLPENPFVEERTAAMTIASNNYFSWGWGNPDPEVIESIDMAPVPVWEDKPTTTPAKNAWPMVIADYSEHKEEAFEVLTTYLDPEIQIGMAKTMMLQTPLIDPEILKYYGAEVPTYEGKNIGAYFFGEAAIYEGRQSNWDQYVDIGEAERRLREDKVDPVTILRELEEESDGKIKSAMGEQ